jgi:5-methylcytosine-specific restriction enzyme subunit McrC
MRTTDNNRGKLVSELGFKPENEEDLLSISIKTIKDLVEIDNLLIFPHSLNAEYKHLEAKDYVFSLHPKPKGEYELHTGNVMGFVGRNNTQLTISSRFYPDNDDLFLHYMLHKVFAINVFDLKHKTNINSIWDFLLYLFPYYLKQALNQGLFKEYQRREYNDANVKGPIDVARHIRINNPFMGKIAYHTREHSYDNSITQLIRHTIEYIKVHKFGSGILFNDADTQNAVNQIIYATPTYEKNSRQKIINQNIRPLNHPYFTEYGLLQKICLQILRQEGLTYGNEKDKVYGLLFDGAWLWEEYLNIILKGKEFEHSLNKDKKNKQFLFEDEKGVIYPDFYKETKPVIVADAKYKHIEKTNFSENDEYGRKDLYQLITYMFRFKAEMGFLLFPISAEQLSNAAIFEKLYKFHVNSYPGNIMKLGLIIPQKKESFKSFTDAIKESEIKFLEKIKINS